MLTGAGVNLNICDIGIILCHIYIGVTYGYSNEKALQVLKILSKEQIIFIKHRLDTGGRR